MLAAGTIRDSCALRVALEPLEELVVVMVAKVEVDARAVGRMTRDVRLAGRPLTAAPTLAGGLALTSIAGVPRPMVAVAAPASQGVTTCCRS